jgi:hypothetical protein
MRIWISAVAALAAVSLLSCGGSDGSTCTHVTGTWHLNDALTSTSSSFCAQAITSGTSTVALSQTTASAFTWTETSQAGNTFVVNGQGNIDACAANVNLTLAGTANKGSYTLTLSASRSVTFTNGAAMSGVSQATYTTSPQQAGTPCTANFTTTAIR